MISMGIDAGKYRRAFEIVLKQLREIRAAKMTREELGSTKKRIASQLLGIPDSPSRLISFYYSQRTNGGSADLKEWVRRVAAVRAADVAAVARKTALDTIYFLRPPSAARKK
jgi:predicted Zn-dependent peptidase